MNKDELNSNLINIAENLLDENHSLNYKLKGKSMYPALKTGDIIKVEKCSSQDLKVGDIVVFKANKSLIGHRLIDISFETGAYVFITRGDTCSRNDAPFTIEALLGKITSFQRLNRVKEADGFVMKRYRFATLHFPKLAFMVYNLAFRYNNGLKIIQSGFQSLKQNLSVIVKNSKNLFLIN